MKKVLYGVLSIFIVAVIAFVSCFFAIPNFNVWVKDKIFSGSTVTPPDEEQGNGESGVIIGDGESNGLKLARARIAPEAYAENGIETTAVDAYVLTAEFENPNTTYQQVAFKTYYVDGTTETVKPSYPDSITVSIEEYINVAQSDNDSMTATVSVKKAFDKQIIVEAYSVAHPETRITSTFDYVCSGVGFLVAQSGTNKAYTVDGNLKLNIGNGVTNPFGGGTLMPDTDNCVTIYFQISGYFMLTSMEFKGYSMPEYVTRTFSYSKEDNAFIIDEPLTVRSILMQFYNEDCGKTKEEFWQDLGNVILSSDSPEDLNGFDILIYNTEVHRVYQGVDYGNDFVPFEEVPNSCHIDLYDYSAFETTSGLQWNGDNGYIF